MAEAGEPYLTGLRLAGRRVAVVGGGSVVQRRLPALLRAGADVVVIAPQVTPTIEGLGQSGRLAWLARGYREGDLAGAWYAMAASDNAEVNAQVVAYAEAARIFCVRVDDATSGSAVTPAMGTHGPVQVAVLGGGDPGRAKAVRDGVLAALGDGRLPAAATRPMPPGASSVPGVALVGAGPGDPDLITVRGRQLLGRAEVVVADRLVPQELLDEIPPDAQLIDAAKLPRGRSMSQEAINQALVEHGLAGRFVVRLKGGDPFVFGRGGEEVRACAAAGVPVTVVPGVTSAIAVPALAGIPLTQRGVAHDAVIVSGHLAPDDPESLVDWSAVARSRGTIVLLMAVGRLGEIASALIAHGKAAATPAAVIQDGSLPDQRVIIATLATVAERAEAEGVRPPAIIVIGAVVHAA